MSLDNYSGLKEAIQSWLFREGDSDFESRADDFIDLAEAYFNDQIRARQQEARAVTNVQSEFIKVPTDFLEHRNLKVNQNPVESLEYVSPVGMDAMYPYSTDRRYPRVFTIIGDEFRLAPAPAGEVEIEIQYYRRIPSLSDTQPTNWLLEQNPNVYLYGALTHAAGFLRDDDQIGKWVEFVDRSIDGLNEASKRSQFNNSPLWPRPDFQTP